MQPDADKHDKDEPRFCYCDRASFGEMISCDGEDCKREWVHLECAGLKSAPPIHGRLSDSLISFSAHRPKCLISLGQGLT